MRRLEIALALSLVLCLLAAAWQLPFSRTCSELRQHTLRLHVVANSDSPADQLLKLQVRDALLADLSSLGDAHSRAEALGRVSAMLPQLEQTVRDTLTKGGCSDEVRLRLCEMWFDRRSYGDATLPAGRYTALRVELGQAAGRNWWCVLYPALCLPAAGEPQQLEGWSEQEKELVFSDGFEIRFWLEEWLQRLAGQRR